MDRLVAGEFPRGCRLTRARLLDKREEIHYTFAGFARALFVYTPTLGSRSRRCSTSCIPAVVSRPLFKGAGTPPQGK